MLQTGVYIWLHEDSGTLYIGSAAKSFSHRKKVHVRKLRKGAHHCKHFQAAWSKYGEDAFSFHIVERCLPEQSLVAEQKWLIIARSEGYRLYNTYLAAGSPFGTKHSEETRRKLSLAGIGRVHSEETKQKISSALKGRGCSEERRKILSTAFLGKKHSEETKQKMSRSQKASWELRRKRKYEELPS